MQVMVVKSVGFDTDEAGIDIDESRLGDQDYVEEIQAKLVAHAELCEANNRIDWVVTDAEGTDLEE